MTFNKPAMSFKQSKQACRLPRETPFCRIPGRKERVGLMESIAETYTLTQAKEPASGKLPNAACSSSFLTFHGGFGLILHVSG